MPTASLSRSDVRQAIGRTIGLLYGGRTYSVTSATTAGGSGAGWLNIVDLPIANADELDGYGLYIASGGGLGQARTVVSLLNTSPAGIPSGSRLYPDRAFAPVPSTNAALEIWRAGNADVVNEFIADAIRSVGHRLLQHKEDAAIQLDDALGAWGSFERWPSGSSSAPLGWTLNGAGAAVAREGTVVYSGRHAAKVTNQAATAAYLETDNLPNYGGLAGKSITVYAKCFTATASRARIAIDDGVAQTYSSYHDGATGWDGNGGTILSATQTISGSPTKLTIQVRTESGDAINVYWGKVWVDAGEHIYEYNLPESDTGETGFAYISEVWLENEAVDGVFDKRLTTDYWDINRDVSPRRLVFRKGMVERWLRAGRQVRVIGQRFPRVPAADTDIIEVSPEYVRAATSVMLIDSMPYDEGSRSRRDRLENYARRFEESVASAPYPDSVAVEPF